MSYQLMIRKNIIYEGWQKQKLSRQSIIPTAMITNNNNTKLIIIIIGVFDEIQKFGT